MTFHVQCGVSPHALSRDVLFFFLSEDQVTNWAAQYLQYQPNGRWNMSKLFSKISRLRGRPTVNADRNIMHNKISVIECV